VGEGGVTVMWCGVCRTNLEVLKRGLSGGGTETVEVDGGRVALDETGRE
jgi:hypothetical protein